MGKIIIADALDGLKTLPDESIVYYSQFPAE